MIVHFREQVCMQTQSNLFVSGYNLIFPVALDIERRLEGVDLRVESCQFLSRCDYFPKAIVLDPALFKKEIGDIYPQAIESLYFELMNLEAEEAMRELRSRISILDPDKFALEFEKIEHQSALKTKQAVRSAFPESQWKHFQFAHISESFHVHFLRQIYLGHTQEILNSYYPGAEQTLFEILPVEPDEKELVHIAIDLLENRSTSPKAAMQYQKIREICAQGDGSFSRRLDEIEKYMSFAPPGAE